jgi:DNA invertase Pin-like site-specific DNA recombinase
VIAFLYARVSTKDKGQDVENQLRQLREFCVRQGWIIAHEYIDHETGSKSDRAELQAMFLACSQRKADVVLFWSLDRLTREGTYLTLRYLNELDSYGVAFRSYTEQYFDSCGIFKEAIIGIIAALAKQERVRLGERVRAGMERARAQGKRFGRPAHDGDAARIGKLRAAGHSLRAIAREVGISEASVRRALKTAGAMRQNGVME